MTVSGYSVDKFPTTQFASVNKYFQNLVNEHLIHLWTQRNLDDDPEDAQKEFTVRHQFKQLIPHLPFCDDLQPPNMLAETLKITALLDSTIQTPCQPSGQTTRHGGCCC